MEEWKKEEKEKKKKMTSKSQARSKKFIRNLLKWTGHFTKIKKKWAGLELSFFFFFLNNRVGYCTVVGQKFDFKKERKIKLKKRH